MVKHTGSQTGPLAGIKVVECCAYIAGPLTAGLLADLGADVIKIEPADSVGDVARRLGTLALASTGEPMSAMFHTINRSKRSVTLDLKRPEGVNVARHLLSAADVFVQNFRPGVIERLGLGWEQLRVLNPSLVMISISGFGQTGPLSNRPVFDSVIQARGGLASLNRNPNGEPSLLRGSLMIDKITPQAGSRAVCAALFARERDTQRRGQHIELSMLDACIEFCWPDGMMNATFVGEDRLYRSSPVSNSAVLLGSADGHIMVPMQVLQPLATALAPEVFEQKAPETYEDLRCYLGEVLASKGLSSADLCSWLDSAGAAINAPVINELEVHKDPQVVHMRSVEERYCGPMGRVLEARPASIFGGTPLDQHDRAPLLGEHTEVVLQEAGFAAADLGELAKAGVFGRSRARL